MTTQVATPQGNQARANPDAKKPDAPKTEKPTDKDSPDTPPKDDPKKTNATSKANAAKDAETAPKKEAVTAKQPDSQKVLLVEDDTEAAYPIKVVLRRMGLKILHATSAAEALETFEEEKPGLVLLDIGLPDMVGWKLLDGIKGMCEDKCMPYCVVITSYGDPANRLMANLQEVDEYLIKPIAPDKVKEVVAKALKSQKKK